MVNGVYIQRPRVGCLFVLLISLLLLLDFLSEMLCINTTKENLLLMGFVHTLLVLWLGVFGTGDGLVHCCALRSGYRKFLHCPLVMMVRGDGILAKGVPFAISLLIFRAGEQ